MQYLQGENGLWNINNSTQDEQVVSSPDEIQDPLANGGNEEPVRSIGLLCDPSERDYDFSHYFENARATQNTTCSFSVVNHKIKPLNIQTQSHSFSKESLLSNQRNRDIVDEAFKRCVLEDNSNVQINLSG